MVRLSFFSICFFCMSVVFAQRELDLQKMIGVVDSNNIFQSKDYYTWCASVIKGDDGWYHMFYSRWPHGVHNEPDDSLNYIFNGFRGWNKYSEIAYAISDNLYGPYKHVSSVLKGPGDTTRWDRFTYHNPLIRKFDGWYYLYFISNSFDASFRLNKPTTTENLQWLKYNCTQKIGVVKAKTIEDLVQGKYVRSSSYLVAPDNKQTFEVATNPAVIRGPDGKFYMMYKSRKPNVGHMTFWMAIADKPDGPFKTVGAVLDDPSLACEDPTMWYDQSRKQFFAVAKYYSNAKKLAPQFGALVLLQSMNGLDWQPAEHSLVSLKQIKCKDGKQVDLNNLERPFIYLDKDGIPVALFAAAAVENPAKANPLEVDEAHNTFNVAIPLSNKTK